MDGRQRKTPAAVFADPVSSSIAWQDIESLLRAVGCTVIEGNGSRVRFRHGGIDASFHRPYPAKVAKADQVRDARALLNRIGVTP